VAVREPVLGPERHVGRRVGGDDNDDDTKSRTMSRVLTLAAGVVLVLGVLPLCGTPLQAPVRRSRGRSWLR
jgi:hypothetical protein